MPRMSGHRASKALTRVPSGWPGPGMDGQAGRLVHHDQVLVLVDGGNRYVLRDQVCGRAGRRDAHGYGVAGPDALGGTGDGSVYRDQAVGGQGLQAATGKAGGG